MRYIIPHHSYATSSSSCTFSNGAWYYPSSTAKGFQVDFTSCAGAKEKYDAVHGIGTATGSRNADRTKLNPPSPKTKPQDNVTSGPKSTDFKAPPNPTANQGGCGSAGLNPDSGCCNCGTEQWYSFLDPNAWGCKIGKLSCEWNHAATKGFDGIGKWFGDNAIWIAGGGIFAIVFLSVILKQM